MNAFRDALRGDRALLGLWQALATPYTAEICARAGYDWLLFDGEHAPNTLQTLLAQLQAVAPMPTEPIARVPTGDPVSIKHYLDIGFRTLLVPMVDSAEQAERIVAASRFPPRGTRGVASATSRASGFGAEPGYLANAHERTCIIAQIESRRGLDALEEIAAVEGIDALFIGPADLAASLGYLGEPGHAEVQDAIGVAIERARRAGIPIGIFALSAEDARARIAAGIDFVSLGTDIGLLARGAAQLRLLVQA
jgi:4-hydroxy-2-oxoheptanedioate aldolase